MLVHTLNCASFELSRIFENVRFARRNRHLDFDVVVALLQKYMILAIESLNILIVIYHNTALKPSLESLHLSVNELLSSIHRIRTAFNAALHTVDAGGLVVTAFGCTSMHVTLYNTQFNIYIYLH